MGKTPKYTIPILLVILLVSCVHRYQTLDPVSYAGNYTRPGDVVFRINKTRDLPTPFGTADIYNRKIDEGSIEVIYRGMPANGIIVLEVRETTIKSKDNTFWRTLGFKPRQKVLPETQHSIKIEYEKTPLSKISGTNLLITEVAEDHIRYMILKGDAKGSHWKVPKVVLAKDGNEKERIKKEEIQLIEEMGVLHVLVRVNDFYPLPFVIDTGAAEVNIPDDVFRTLRRAGKIRKSDHLPGKVYTLGDGSAMPSRRFRIRKLTIGSHEFRNVQASIGKLDSPLLLGTNVLKRFGSYQIDHKRQVLIVD